MKHINKIIAMFGLLFSLLLGIPFMAWEFLNNCFSHGTAFKIMTIAVSVGLYYMYVQMLRFVYKAINDKTI